MNTTKNDQSCTIQVASSWSQTDRPVHEVSRFLSRKIRSGEKQPGKRPLGGASKKTHRRRCLSLTQVLHEHSGHILYSCWGDSAQQSRRGCYCTTVSMSFHERNQQMTILLIDLHRGETRDHQSQRQTCVVLPLEMHPANFSFLSSTKFDRSKPQSFQSHNRCR